MTTTPGLWRSGFVDNAMLSGGQSSGVVAPTIDDQFFAVWVSATGAPRTSLHANSIALATL
jgi:hypothetical protein